MCEDILMKTSKKNHFDKLENPDALKNLQIKVFQVPFYNL